MPRRLTQFGRRSEALGRVFPYAGDAAGISSRRLLERAMGRALGFGMTPPVLNVDRILEGGFNLAPSLQGLFPGGQQTYIQALRARQAKLGSKT